MIQAAPDAAAPIACSLTSQEDTAARVADLAVREQQCCPFFSFTIEIAAGPWSWMSRHRWRRKDALAGSNLRGEGLDEPDR